MNESVNNITNERERDPLHEKLCAYLLGEASDAERAEVEAALSASAELRAERQRLEATIGLVRTTLASGASADELSPTAAAALKAAAEARRPRAAPLLWYQSSALKLAAGLAAVGLMWAAWSRSGEDGQPASQTVARLEAPAAAPAAREGLLGRPEASRADGSAVKDEVVVAMERLGGLGYVGDDSSVSAAVPLAKERKAIAKRFAEEQKTDSEREGEVLGQTIAELDALGFEETAVTAYSEERAPDFLSDVPFESASGVDSDALQGLPAEPAAEVAKGTYRGPGDTSPPGGPAALGPASPGASSAGTFGGRFGGKGGGTIRSNGRAETKGTDDFFLGQGEKDGAVQPSQSELAELRELGYIGNEEEPVLQDSELAEELRELGYLGGKENALKGLGYIGDENEGSDRFRRQAADRDQIQERLMQALDACQRYPDERPRDMFFRFFGDNPFQQALVDPLSTFAADVDTASYTLARRYLVDGVLPEKAQVRTEEFVNYFDSDVPAPLEETFAIHAELAPSRFGWRGGDSWMLRVAVRGKDVTREERAPLSLTFVIDTSGSMKEDGRLELVKHALRLLLGELDARDSIAIVAFSSEARVVLPMTSARNRSLAETAIYQLQPGGSTNAEAGLRLGYELARSELALGSHHRVVLLSDGVANVGQTSQQALSAAVEEHRRAGIYLNTVGVGMGNHNDALLEQLADKGDGVCNYVDDAAEARRALVERFTGAFEPIARDVKIQVEFDPAQVQRYRLLGYENRAVADRDFRNDAVDAGEVNAGHQVVALYELSALPQEGAERPLAPLATVRLRYKPPHPSGVADVETEVASEIERAVSWKDAAPGFSAASFGYRRSVLVAQFAEFLRRSVHARYDSLDELLAEVRALAREQDDPDVSELVDMVGKSRELILTERARHDDFVRALESVREACYLEAELEELNVLLGRDRLHSLEDTLRELALRIRLLRERIQAEEFSLRQGELEAFQIENERLAALVFDLLRELSTASRR